VSGGCHACSVDDAGNLEFTCDSASLRGSSHVQQLGLEERFELDVRVTLRPDATCLTADASVNVTVDLPMPFSLLPKPVLNPLSDSVMQTMSSLFLVRIHPCSRFLVFASLTNPQLTRWAPGARAPRSASSWKSSPQTSSDGVSRPKGVERSIAYPCTGGTPSSQSLRSPRFQR